MYRNLEIKSKAPRGIKSSSESQGSCEIRGQALPVPREARSVVRVTRLTRLNVPWMWLETAFRGSHLLIEQQELLKLDFMIKCRRVKACFSCPEAQGLLNLYKPGALRC